MSLIYARDQHFPNRKILRLIQLQTEISWKIARDSSLKNQVSLLFIMMQEKGMHM